MAASLSYNDGVLAISLLYLSIDMQNGHEFASCKWPIDRWLLGSYIFIIAFRLIHILGDHYAGTGTGDFLLNLRHKEKLPHFLMSLTWMCVLPMFAVWTGIGTYWLYESRSSSVTCLPVGMPLGFIITWQTLSYAWIILHTSLGGVAWVLERRLRHREDSLRSLEDSDTLARWGSISQLPGYTALANTLFDGLTPEQIKRLPETSARDIWSGKECECECSICLTCLDPDDAARQLGGCGHIFHRSCIDLWLLRRADCPLCKRSVLDTYGHLLSNDMCEQWHV